MVKKMSREQKYKLMRGVGWEMYDLQPGYYVGTTEAIPELDIPGQHFFDASGGFRTIFPELVGTVSCWPSMLALASTFDPSIVESFAGALATEFKGKGANGILGPGVNVNRVARNGRNFEYISGEDPYLGSKMAAAYVTGVQNEGVMTVTKHYALNHEEAKRDSGSSNADDKTVWELYYPPFQAAIDAGTTAAMCSYNKEDEVYSCSNEKTLQSMKVGMGFQGFVQSDWWATHETSVAQGLDQMQPNALCCEENEDGELEKSFKGEEWFNDTQLDAVSAAAIDASATRVLAAMYKVGIKSNVCEPPYCNETLLTMVTNDDHAFMAREAAKEAIVMLKNEDVLPLSPAKVKTLAIIGSAAAALAFNPNNPNQGSLDWATGDYYAGGGSGHVTAPYVITPLEGISNRALLDGIVVLNSTSDNFTEAIEIAKQADVTIVVGGTSSGESRDRESLSLDNNADALISAVSYTGTKVVVLTQTCGAITMPWRDDVSAVLSLFLGGQETGNAWADVLFGAHSPTGHLPIMIPATDDDQIPPSASDSIIYAEGMATSYRNKNFKAAYPFGHGLAYTTFEYGKFQSHSCGEDVCVVGKITNVGERSAQATPQVYLEFPIEAGFPAPVLKGFQKTDLVYPGASAKITFRLTNRDLSYFDGLLGDGYSPKWTKVKRAVAHVGASSADIRQTVSVEVGAGPEMLV